MVSRVRGPAGQLSPADRTTFGDCPRARPAPSVKAMIEARVGRARGPGRRRRTGRRGAVRGALAAEWTKIRSVRSTLRALLLAFLLSVGLSYVIGRSFRAGFQRLPPGQRAHFDPLFATFYGLTIGQLPLVVFAVLVVANEYTSGTIRMSLVAVPRRGLFYSSKIIVGALVAACFSLLTVAVTFPVAQSALGPHGTSLAAGGSAQAACGACLYLTLICLFSMGVAAILRSSARSLAILLPLFFLGSQGLGNIPRVKTVTQYLPDQAGMVIMHLTGPPGDPRFSRGYGPWAGLGITMLWTAAVLLCGYIALLRRDA
jgi:ABC-2 type transport system permease protein